MAKGSCAERVHCVEAESRHVQSEQSDADALRDPGFQ